MPSGRLLHYEILRTLGRGGMGEVVEAHDTRLDRRVALKFVAPEFAAHAEVRARFESEARAASACTHPNVATVYAFETGPEGPFLCMELLTGGTLRELLQRGALPVGQALRIAREVSAGLAAAHEHRLIHRDVKPENVMFDRYGNAKLTDFGLAHAVDAAHLTRPGTTLGTPAYMSPEAVRGRAGARGDVFAVGVMLYEMLTGTQPFQGGDTLAVMYAIENREPPPLLERRAEAGEAAAALVRQLLAKDEGARPSAAEAMRALEQLTGAGSGTPAPGSEQPTQALPVLPARQQSTLEPPVERLALEPRPPAPRPRRVLWLAAAAVVLVAAVAALLGQRAAADRQAAVAHTNAGAEAFRAGDIALAQREFEQALQRDGRRWTAAIGLARVELAQHRPSAAAQRLQQVLDRLPRGDAVLRQACWSGLSDIAFGDGNWEDALVNARRAFAEDSSDAAVWNQYGYALLRTGAADSARMRFEAATARFPGIATLQRNLGLAYLMLGDVARADRLAAAALRLQPDFTPALVLQSRIALRRGDHERAVGDYARAAAAPDGAADTLELGELRRELLASGALPR